MSQLNFRDHHLCNLISQFENSLEPLDFFIHKYFKANKAIGSKDRAYIADRVYTLVRWKGLLDKITDGSWLSKIKVIENSNFINELEQKENLAAHDKVSFPLELFEMITSSHGLEKAQQICLESNKRAPTTIRVNSLKTSREQLLQSLKAFSPNKTETSLQGITLNQRANLFSIPQFEEGLFEMQDEGSQLIADMVKIKPGQLLLDFCAGSGGKSLAIAPKMESKGQIYLHDIRQSALLQAKKRFKRAGIENYQLIHADSQNLKKLKKKFHWVLVDAPCSGSGTLRRNPDMKWKIDRAMVSRLCSEQRQIFEKALSFLHPEGKIVYATCSVLNEENIDQVNHFLKTYELCIETAPWQSLPAENSMDGFFAVVFKRK